MRKPVLIAALTFGLLIISFLVHAEVYKWVDEEGNVHFTDDNSTIPEEYRQQVEKRCSPQGSRPVTGGAQKENEFSKPMEQEKTESKPVDVPRKSSFVKETPFIFSGQIIKIDKVEKMLAIGGKEGTIEFTVSENTKIATDLGKSVLFTELWRGMLVTVEYLKKGGAIYPVKIKINTVELYRGRR
jgi:hypothetical protein